MMAEESGGDAMQVVMRCMWRCTAGGDTTQVTMKMVTQNSHSLLRSSFNDIFNDAHGFSQATHGKHSNLTLRTILVPPQL